MHKIPLFYLGVVLRAGILHRLYGLSWMLSLTRVCIALPTSTITSLPFMIGTFYGTWYSIDRGGITNQI
jgi:hypothetical protein